MSLEPAEPAPRLLTTAGYARLHATFRVGPRFLHSTNLACDEDEPAGLVDDIGELEVDASRIDPAVREFYERTNDFDVTVRPYWESWLRHAYRPWRHAVRVIGQIELPYVSSGTVLPVRNEVRKLREEFLAPGARNGRLWTRTYRTRSDHTMYAAAFGTAAIDGRQYVEMAFPMPRGCLRAMLLLRAIPRSGRGHGVELLIDHAADECTGFWYETRLGTMRLPSTERIVVEAADASRAGGASVTARQEHGLRGTRYLTVLHDFSRRS